MLKRVDHQLLFRLIWALVVLVWNAAEINGSTTHIIIGTVLEVLVFAYLVMTVVSVVKQIRDPTPRPAPAPAPPGSATSWITPEAITVLIVVFVVVFFLARVVAPS